MIGPDVEVEACGVAVTAASVVLTVQLEGDLGITLTMPRQLGETMAAEISAAARGMPAIKPM